MMTHTSQPKLAQQMTLDNYKCRHKTQMKLQRTIKEDSILLVCMMVTGGLAT